MRNAEPMPAAPPVDIAASVTCRPSRLFWIFVFYGLFSGVGLWLTASSPTKNGPPSPGAVLSMQCLGVSLGPASFVLALWLGRTRIVADGAGLRWRRFGGWKCAGWGEVLDYYDRLRGQGQAKRAGVRGIKTVAGEIRFGYDWPGAEALREAVERQATGTAAREWGLLGTRPCDPWPRVFGYDTFSNRWSPRLLVKLSLVFVVYVLVKPALSLTGLAALLGWRMTLTTAALYLLLTVPLAVMLLVRPLLDYRAVQKRLGERITLTPEGLMFEDGTRRIDARWDEVTGYGIADGKYTVETGGGAFDFVSSIGNGLLLRENIRLYAAKAADTEWKVRTDADALGGEGACWRGGQVGVGARVFHYRTRFTRRLLWYGVLLIVFFCAVGEVSSVGSANSSLIVALIALPLIAALLRGWQTYRWGGIYLDEDGLTQWTPLGRRRLAWAQINDFYLSKGDAPGGVQRVVEGRDGRRIRFSALIVGDEELKSEIGRRAAHCGRTEWEKRSPA